VVNFCSIATTLLVLYYLFVSVIDMTKIFMNLIDFVVDVSLDVDFFEEVHADY
jgi:hypothetical protein